jgi:hypothetical protein
MRKKGKLTKKVTKRLYFTYVPSAPLADGFQPNSAYSEISPRQFILQKFSCRSVKRFKFYRRSKIARFHMNGKSSLTLTYSTVHACDISFCSFFVSLFSSSRAQVERLNRFLYLFNVKNFSLTIELRTTNYTCKTANIKISILRGLRVKCLLTCFAESILLIE